jgi:fermentation-respiration switch protein FrsA (DUF1100 family)
MLGSDLMLYAASLILKAIYFILPVTVLAVRVRRAVKTDDYRGLISLAFLCVWAILIGVGLPLAFAYAADAFAPISQIALTAYLAVAALLVLRFANEGLFKLSRLARPATPFRAYLLGVGFAIGRVAIMVGVGLPYVMSTLMVYRPKVVPLDDPASRLGVNFERVAFTAVDGTRIVGWWMPAVSMEGDRARDTVLVCHGLGSNKSNHLILAVAPLNAGYNVLAIDLRAHGESGGQLCTFGDRERLDALAAVRWLTATQPQRSHRILGVGASMGAAALLAAAVDGSDDAGQRIDGVVAYGTYDNLRELVDTVTTDYFPTPLAWLLKHVGVPIASFHTGRNLMAFAPGDFAQQLWPRPLLVIHGADDEIIRFEHGHRLYQRALQPKQHIWIGGGTHNGIVGDQPTAREVIEFLDNARRIL